MPSEFQSQKPPLTRNSKMPPVVRYGYFLESAPIILSLETLLRLAELVLTLNCFSFTDSYFKQINGVAMGNKMGPSYANLFVINPELLNALTHDAKHVLSFATLRKYRDPSDRSRSLIISPVPQQMSSTA